MIGTIDIKVNVAHPEMPLAPFYAFVNSPSQVRVVNVPRSIGSWKLTAVYITANYPDNTSRSVACTLTGGCWHGTLPGSTATGTAANGFTVTANGVMEDGETTVTGYVLGKGDLYILDIDATLTVGETTYYAHVVDTQPTTPHKGDLCVIDNVYKLYNGTAWVSLGGGSGTSDYTDLTNKPQINSVELIGNKSLSDIGAVAKAGDTMTGNLALQSGSAMSVVTVTLSTAAISKRDGLFGSIKTFNYPGQSGTLVVSDEVDAAIVSKIQSICSDLNPATSSIADVINALKGN